MPFTGMIGVILYGDSAQMPKARNTVVNVPNQNQVMKVKGRTQWEDISFSCYHFEGITGKELWGYLNKHQTVPSAIDKQPSDYLGMVQIKLLSPIGVPIHTIKLQNAFLAGADWGDGDWGVSEIMKCTITLSYEYAEYN